MSYSSKGRTRVGPGTQLPEPKAVSFNKDPSERRQQQSHPDKHDPNETKKHAKEIKAIQQGKNIVDKLSKREKPPPAFSHEDLLVVRSWLEKRPLESEIQATALIQFPRMWNTKRGRYCKFRAPQAGVYGILRARPSF